jgi:sRNA-binding protein
MSKACVRQIHALLMERFPVAFPRNYDAIRPLKVGIEQDLTACLGNAVDPRLLRRALANHTERAGYLLAVLHGPGVRVDLDGNPAGVVDEPARAAAAQQLAVIQERQQAVAQRYRAHKKRERQLQAEKARRRAERERQAEEKARRRTEQERQLQEKLARQQTVQPQATPAQEAQRPPALDKSGPQITYKKRKKLR